MCVCVCVCVCACVCVHLYKRLVFRINASNSELKFEELKI